mmetsp:Transcript_22947/g.47940  ORF Transcript_22947/g.47940 Transcript_22947/m.47940 type:complete len:307 (+) Transcript_22947:1078-1998(+)
MPNFSNRPLCSMGYRTISWRSRLVSSKPPMSSHLMSGTSTLFSRSVLGSHTLNACMKCSLSTTIWSSTSSGMGSSLSTSMFPMFDRMHSNAASNVSCCRSAPMKPCVSRAIWNRSTSGSVFMSFILICRISCLPSSSGMATSNSRSNRPGRRSADSMTLGRFVAPITMTFELGFNESMSVRSCDTMRFSVSPWACSRFGAMESSSSMKMMAGLFSWASSNAWRRLASLSPPLRAMISGPLMMTTCAPVSSMRALAMRVFPQPGGPWRRTPLGVGTPAVVQSSGKRRGSSTSSCMSLMALVQPPTES